MKKRWAEKKRKGSNRQQNPKLLRGFLWSESRARTKQRSVDGSRFALFDPTFLRVQFLNNAQVHPNP
jgi:hypothetical protein